MGQAACQVRANRTLASGANSASTRVSRAVHCGQGPASWVLLGLQGLGQGNQPGVKPRVIT